MFNQKNESAVTACATDLQTVVALGSDTMGAGDDQLGRVLMKSFLYTLTQLHCQPEAMVLYNSAVKMAEEGAESVEIFASWKSRVYAFWSAERASTTLS